MNDYSDIALQALAACLEAAFNKDFSDLPQLYGRK